MTRMEEIIFDAVIELETQVEQLVTRITKLEAVLSKVIEHAAAALKGTAK